MRIALKKNIMEIFSSLIEAHGEVEKLIDSRQADAAIQLLTDCQETAAQIGDIVADNEGGRSPVIVRLQDYCETVYHVALDISGGMTGARAKRLLDKKLESARADMERVNAPARVAFFPYNASMWTAFSSIWQAAVNKGCEVKVVPVPCCDVNNDGTAGRWHCDTDNYPVGVKLTMFNEYDIEKEEPDIAVIHNGYDDGNTLVRVHPAFYSERIKEHCGKLVYSPYCTMGSFTPGKSDAIFANNGAAAADKIVVQSEFTANIFEGYGFDREKLVVQGSPKIDEVILRCSGDYDRDSRMPEKWKQKLSGKKKIFMLNTHWSYFLKGALALENGTFDFDFAQRYHDQFFNVMKKYSDSCGMIWRPHPLMMTALRQRAPQLLDYVNGFIEKIEASDFAVVDDSADYLDAFCCSDAMVTTYSTLVNEYLVTGKPVLIFQSKPTALGGARSPIDYGKCYFTFKKDGGMTYTQFTEMVLEGKDPGHDERMKMLREKSFANMDGTAGKRILDELLGGLK